MHWCRCRRCVPSLPHRRFIIIFFLIAATSTSAATFAAAKSAIGEAAAAAHVVPFLIEWSHASQRGN